MATPMSNPARKLRKAPISAARRARVTPGKRERVIVQIRDFPPSLKDAIVAKALADGTNMNDIAVAILAEAFNVKFFPSGRRPTVPAGGGLDITFQMPLVLRRKIKQAAASNDIPMRDVVLTILSNQFRP